MRKLLTGTALSLLMVGSASAADMMVKAAPAYSWTGIYIGANAGAVTGNSDLRFTSSATPAFFEHDAITTGGWVAGGTVGANYQLGRVVVGIEADFDAASIV